MKTEYERIMEGWTIGLTDRELSEQLANIENLSGEMKLSDAAINALILEDWRRKGLVMRLTKRGLLIDVLPSFHPAH